MEIINIIIPSTLYFLRPSHFEEGVVIICVLFDCVLFDAVFFI